jgi:hypothetical protein
MEMNRNFETFPLGQTLITLKILISFSKLSIELKTILKNCLET